jgi:hypothetical protein
MAEVPADPYFPRFDSTGPPRGPLQVRIFMQRVAAKANATAATNFGGCQHQHDCAARKSQRYAHGGVPRLDNAKPERKWLGGG